MPKESAITSFAGRYAEALGKRTKEFNGLTTRELSIYLAGQEDGANIKADECQIIVSTLEAKVGESPINIPT